MDDVTPLLERFDSYERAREQFLLRVPDRFNLAEAVCRRRTDAVTRPAVVESRIAGNNTYTYGAIDFLSDKFANALSSSGVERGDAVGVILPQSAALVVAHFGVLKLGAVVVPLPTAADERLIQHALIDSGAKAVVIDEALFDRIREIVSSCIDSQAIFIDADCRDVDVGVRDFWRQVYSSSPDFNAAETEARAPAFIFYHSDSNAKPTGIAHSHCAAIGELAAFEMLGGLPVRSSAKYCLMADWANPDSLLRILYPAWWYGCSVVANRDDGLDAGEALRLIKATEATDLFLLEKNLDSFIEASRENRLDLKLETIVMESLALNKEAGSELADRFNASVNTFCATNETSIAVMKCDGWFSPRFGSLGRPAPGRMIEITDDSGNIMPAGAHGHVAVHRTDAALIVEHKPDRIHTGAQFAGDWFKTGLAGYKDEDGFLWPVPSSF